ncbi:50S ribosomal protein L3 [Weissella ceti]|nr:50S ribosomal protein L3 [Weissella ceti]
MTTKGILGRKVGMTQVFTENGELIPVTVIEATPNVVFQVKSMENDGYEAIQLGFDDKRAVLSNKPEQGHAAKANTTPKRYIREIRNAEGEFNVGDEVKVDIFAAGEAVDVTGITKGHGFQGNIKKDGQSRGLCLTDHVTTVDLVQWVLLSTACSRVRSCQDVWETTSVLFKLASCSR